jgi:hypothetical protein
VGVEDAPLELVGIYSGAGRDPRPERVISVAYLSVLLSAEPEVAPVSGADVVEARWVPVTGLADEVYGGAPLGFDHARIIADARRKLSDLVPYGRREEVVPELLFAFLPAQFTLGHAMEVMTILKQQETDPSNFRKYIITFVEPTGTQAKTSTRNAALFRRRLGAGLVARSLPPGIERLRRIAMEAQIGPFDAFLSAILDAPDEVVRLIGGVLTTYGRHREHGVSVAPGPELRITDLATGKALVALRWEGALALTALAAPGMLTALGLADLTRAAAEQIDEVVRLSRAAMRAS